MRNGVGDARTRTNQAEPKTGKAIYEDESFRGVKSSLSKMVASEVRNGREAS